MLIIPISLLKAEYFVYDCTFLKIKFPGKNCENYKGKTYREKVPLTRFLRYCRIGKLT